MAFVIEYDLEVEAPASVVWEVITDFPRYGEWNPFVRECHSTLEPGEPIDMQVKIFGKPQGQREIIDEYREGRGFSYRMKPAPLGALRSYRSHDIQDLGSGRSRYRSYFELDGWLAPVVKAIMGGRLRAGFADMSEGIRERAQTLAHERSAA